MYTAAVAGYMVYDTWVARSAVLLCTAILAVCNSVLCTLLGLKTADRGTANSSCCYSIIIMMFHAWSVAFWTLFLVVVS